MIILAMFIHHHRYEVVKVIKGINKVAYEMNYLWIYLNLLIIWMITTYLNLMSYLV